MGMVSRSAACLCCGTLLLGIRVGKVDCLVSTATKSIIEDFSLRHEFDHSSVPVDFVLSEFKKSLAGNIDEDLVSFGSNLVDRYEIDASLYAETTKKRHGDGQNLFEGYTTRLVRCEVLDESSCNMRWNGILYYNTGFYPSTDCQEPSCHELLLCSPLLGLRPHLSKN